MGSLKYNLYLKPLLDLQSDMKKGALTIFRNKQINWSGPDLNPFGFFDLTSIHVTSSYMRMPYTFFCGTPCMYGGS